MSWKFLIPKVFRKVKLSSLAEETSTAGKILVQRNLEEGCISSTRYIDVAFQNRLKLSLRNCCEICLQIDLKSSVETKME